MPVSILNAYMACFLCTITLPSPLQVHQLSPLGGGVGKVAKVPAARRRMTDVAPDLLVKLSHGGTTT